MKPQNPSALHILAFVYLTFSHVTDGELEPRGDRHHRPRAARVAARRPPATQISRVIVDTAAWVNGITSDEERLAQAETYAHLMKEQMSEKQRSAVLVNLIELARADGKITATEEQFIGHLTRILGLG